ncbi:MAG: divalent-cation tolerance protein CutA [Bryobacterales bacterium]|nr:divalent-cation tolerance protein CutA [Bryobacterales bacterium]
MTDKVVVLTTCGSAEEAERVARALLDARVAACVNILPGVRSLYHWRGAVEESGEWLLVIKSSRAAFARLSAELRKAHSYEVPEILALPVVEGAPEYLEWLDREMRVS